VGEWEGRKEGRVGEMEKAVLDGRLMPCKVICQSNTQAATNINIRERTYNYGKGSSA
jgi:hypothetical protein